MCGLSQNHEYQVEEFTKKILYYGDNEISNNFLVRRLIKFIFGTLVPWTNAILQYKLMF